MGFGSLQHIKNRRSAHAGTPARHVPPSGFGYPLGGLLPSIPRRFSFTPAALLGFALRSVSLSKGIRGHYPPDEPTYRSTCRCSRRRSVRPAQQAPVPGFQPSRESLATGQRVSLSSCRMLPWVSALLGFSTGDLVQALTRTPLSRFKRHTTNRLTPLRPRVSISPRPALSLPSQQAATIGQGDPSRVLAPAQSRAFERPYPLAMGSPLTVSCIAADQPSDL
jgi:hypothetical protein